MVLLHRALPRVLWPRRPGAAELTCAPGGDGQAFAPVCWALVDVEHCVWGVRRGVRIPRVAKRDNRLGSHPSSHRDAGKEKKPREKSLFSF